MDSILSYQSHGGGEEQKKGETSNLVNIKKFKNLIVGGNSRGET
jgi:hypothetical protein